jgi:hypothetical protein
LIRLLFISPHAQYQLVGITTEVVDYHPTNGRIIGTRRGIDAEFFHGGAPSWALEQALSNETFKGAWSGLPDGVDYRAYVSSYNTEDQQRMLGWDDETREYVEQFLLNHQDNGNKYIQAVPPAQVEGLPWPTFNELHHSRVLIVAREIGADLNEVLAYERTHKARPFVIEGLEKAIERNPQPVEELVTA